MLSNILAPVNYELSIFIDNAAAYIPLCTKIVLFFWVIHILNHFSGYILNHLGILPRTKHGLIGIVISPLLHGDFNHLIFNSLPLFSLLLLILTLFPVKTLIAITIFVTLVSGLFVWLFGRRAVHIGASGLITGYYGFVLAIAYYKPTITSIFIVLIALYYMGGVLFSVIPVDKGTSYEAHIFGMLSGAGFAALMQYTDLFNFVLKI